MNWWPILCIGLLVGAWTAIGVGVGLLSGGGVVIATATGCGMLGAGLMEIWKDR